MKKFSIVIIVVLVSVFANIAFANPNDKADEYSDPTVKVVVEYTAPDAKAQPAKVERDTPAKIDDALKLHAGFRRLDNPISFR